MGIPALFFLSKKTLNRDDVFPRGNERGCPEPRPKLLIIGFEATFTLNPFLAVSVIVRETTAPIAKVGETFILERDLMRLPILESDESSSTERFRDINQHYNPYKTTTLTVGSFIGV